MRGGFEVGIQTSRCGEIKVGISGVVQRLGRESVRHINQYLLEAMQSNLVCCRVR